MQVDAALAEQQERDGGMEEIQTGSLSWKGMPVGRVLSPTMGYPVVGRLLRLLSEAGFFTKSYVDNVIIIINGIEPRSSRGCDFYQEVQDKASNRTETVRTGKEGFKRG